MHKQSEIYMQHAIALSRDKMHEGEGGPFGAVIVRGQAIIAEGWNRVTLTQDPTAHAEVTAIRNACVKLGTHELTGCDIYTSCEPCPMCLGAIYWARIDHIYYANRREDAASIGFDDQFIYEEMAKNLEHRSLPCVRIETPNAAMVFLEWKNKQDKIPY
jgi:tRNA(Arg) A34 adenosine deaminase TadA